MRDDDSDTPVEFLTRAQLQEFLAALVGEPDEPLIRFLAWTGVRLGEALALRWSEVDLVDRVASIRWPVRLDPESQPETRFGIRTVDLATRLVKVLEELPSRAAGGLVFPAPGGGYGSARNIHTVFQRISKRAGLPPVHPHMLRHTWATQMLSAGAPLNYVSRSLGHRSTVFTAGVYAVGTPDSRGEQAEALASDASDVRPISDYCPRSSSGSPSESSSRFTEEDGTPRRRAEQLDAVPLAPGTSPDPKAGTWPRSTRAHPSPARSGRLHVAATTPCRSDVDLLPQFRYASTSEFERAGSRPRPERQGT